VLNSGTKKKKVRKQLKLGTDVTSFRSPFCLKKGKLDAARKIESEQGGPVERLQTKRASVEGKRKPRAWGKQYLSGESEVVEKGSMSREGRGLGRLA